MSSMIRMKRAHDEKISFWPASGSVVVVSGRLSSSRRRRGHCSPSGSASSASRPVQLDVSHNSARQIEHESSDSIRTEKLESSGTYDGSHCGAGPTTLENDGGILEERYEICIEVGLCRSIAGIGFMRVYITLRMPHARVSLLRCTVFVPRGT